MSVDLIELQDVVQELAELSTLPKLTSQQNRRFTFLLSQQSLLKAGFSSRDIQAADLNRRERAAGLPLTRLVARDEDERRNNARVWQHFCRTGELPQEQRDEAIGNPKPGYLLGSMGSFVPREFFNGIFAASRIADPFTDPNFVTLVKTEHGRPIQVPMYDSTNNYASVVGENTNLTNSESDIVGNPYSLDLQSFSYRSLPFRMSIEALTDVDQMANLIDIFQRVAGESFQRGFVRDCVTGTGNGKTLGLLTSLAMAGNCQAAVAQGSSETTGGAQTGKNSIGNTDITNLYYAVNENYRASKSCAWLANDTTKESLAQILDKYGRPLYPDLAEGRNLLMGKPFLTSPTMPSIGAGNTPLIFGDLSYWTTRIVVGIAGQRVQLLRELPNVIERGEVALMAFFRADGVLTWSPSVSGTPPLMYLVNHS